MPHGHTAIWHWLNVVYDAMKAEAQRGKFNGRSCLIYEGFVTKLCTEYAVPHPYYGQILQALKGMGCIEQIKRGARSVPSQWAVYKKPTKKDFEIVKKSVGSKRARDITTLEQEVKDMRATLGGIDLKAVLKNMDDRIKKQNAEIARLKKKVSA